MLLTAKQTTINRRIPERALASFKVRVIYEQSMLARVRQIKFNKFVVIFLNLPLDKSHYILDCINAFILLLSTEYELVLGRKGVAVIERAHELHAENY